MKHTNLGLVVLVAAMGMQHALAAASPEQVTALEERIAQLEGRSAAAPATGDRIKINGFISAGFGWADTADGQYYDTGLNDTVSHTVDSVAGLQFDARVADRTNAVIQLVGRGADDFNAGIE